MMGAAAGWRLKLLALGALVSCGAASGPSLTVTPLERPGCGRIAWEHIDLQAGPPGLKPNILILTVVGEGGTMVIVAPLNEKDDVNFCMPGARQVRIGTALIRDTNPVLIVGPMQALAEVPEPPPTRIAAY